jgi:PAS domain S-box-containing protein
MNPPSPDNQTLRATRDYEVLDTGTEETLDEIVRVAAHACRTPAATITFVDASHQSFNTAYGLDLGPADRDLSFCAQAVLTPDILVVPDATLDSRFADDPLVTGPPNIRSCAAVPVTSRGGPGLGTLAVIDFVPRGFTLEELDSLQILSRQVTLQLELRRGVIRKRELVATAEASLPSSAEHLRALFDSALDAIVTMDALGRITEFNLAAERLFGYQNSDAVGRLMADLIIPPRLRERHTEGLARFVRTGEAVILGRRLEMTALRHDGTEFPVELSIHRVGQGEPPVFTGFIRDISESKQLEAQLRQSQKLEAVGQLAGGVAHDFNNLLTVIHGHASLLLPEMQTTERRDSIRQIIDAAERAGSLTRQLLAFSRKQVLQTADLALNVIVSSMVRLLQRILGEDIGLQIDLSPADAFVRADASMMEQVILNLAINARDAMPRGGQLSLRTTVAEFDTHSIPEHTDARAGRFVRLSVIDTGCGVPADILPHIFEPFFSTKGMERGTGLGLATVYGIVKQHHGWVMVHSAVDSGTTFDVYLPAVEIPEKSASPREPEPSGAGGNETILIVEDEAPVRRLARVILQRRGYTVLEAESGPAAIAVWQEHQGHVDLMLTDMVMPHGLSGLDLAERFLAERSSLKVIVTSGYSVDLAGKEITQTERLRFLAKPYSVLELAGAVRAMLDAE